MRIPSFLAAILATTFVAPAIAREPLGIYQAIKATDVARVAELLKSNPALARARSVVPGGRSRRPVHAAAFQGNKEVVDLLVSHGARMDLFVACGLGMDDCVAVYLKADPDAAKAAAWDHLT